MAFWKFQPANLEGFSLISQRSHDKLTARRVGTAPFGLKFRMELAGHKPRMVFEFHDLDQTLGGIDAGEKHPLFFKKLAIFVVELISVTMALGDVFLFIGCKTAR